MWRKTRSKTKVPGCYGADPNRNWDSHHCGKILFSLYLYFELNSLIIYLKENGASRDPCR